VFPLKAGVISFPHAHARTMIKTLTRIIQISGLMALMIATIGVCGLLIGGVLHVILSIGSLLKGHH
jgi:hypothetical protein